jgi:hypothetical protein
MDDLKTTTSYSFVRVENRNRCVLAVAVENHPGAYGGALGFGSFEFQFQRRREQTRCDRRHNVLNLTAQLANSDPNAATLRMRILRARHVRGHLNGRGIRATRVFMLRLPLLFTLLMARSVTE